MSVFSESGSLSQLDALHHEAGFQTIGFDEALYRGYVDDLIRYGVSSYPDLAERYVEVTAPSADGNSAAYTFSLRLRGRPVAWDFWHRRSWLASRHFESVQHIVLGFNRRIRRTAGGWRIGLCVMALMVCAPTQIHMAQHALIDGFFAFWATASLWLLWENLRRPNYAPLLALYGLNLTLLVLTKENAMFVYLGLLAALTANRWLHFGTITSSLLGVSIIGPLAGVVTLVFLCGGVTLSMTPIAYW